MSETLDVTFSKDMLVIYVTLWDVFWKSADVSKKLKKMTIFADNASYNYWGKVLNIFCHDLGKQTEWNIRVDVSVFQLLICHICFNSI